MSRLSMDTLNPSSSVGRARPTPGVLDLIPAEGAGFDAHLQRAAREQQPAGPQTASDLNRPGETKPTSEAAPSPSKPERAEPRPEECQASDPAKNRPADAQRSESKPDAGATSTSDETDEHNTDATETSVEPVDEDTEGDQPTAEDTDKAEGQAADGTVLVISEQVTTEDTPKSPKGQPTAEAPAVQTAEKKAEPTERKSALQQEQMAAKIAAQETSGMKVATTESTKAAAGAEPVAKGDVKKKEAATAAKESRIQVKPVAEVAVEGETQQPDPTATASAAEVVEPVVTSTNDRASRTKDTRRAAAAQRVEASKTASPQQDASTGMDAAQPASPATSEAAASVTKTTLEAAPREAAPVAPVPTGREAPAQTRSTVGEATRPAAPAPSGAEGSAADGVDRVRFVERVARAFGSSSQEGGVIRMRLHPPELGSMRIEIAMRDGAMTARLETDTAETRNLLLDNLPALRDRLAQQDIKIERFEVAYNQSGLGGGSPEGPDDRRSARGESGRRAGAAAESSQAAEPVARRGVALPGQGTRLDVFV